MSALKNTAKAILRSVAGERFQVAESAAQGYRWKFGSYPNLIFPKTFNEKIQRRKVFDRDLRLSMLADKVLVKDYVREKIGEKCLIPTIWHGSELPPHAQRTWPIPFVIKSNHASGWNVFVRSESDCDWDHIEKCCRDWMSKSYGTSLGEWHYSKIKPQILVEPFIGEVASLPVDYKLWTFNGKVHFIQVDTDRDSGHKRAFFDKSWNKLPFSLEFPMEDRDISRPSSLDTMIKYAETLADDIPFVRVDFYEVNHSPLFGEMTFYPESGYGRFFPEESGRKVGALWT